MQLRQQSYYLIASRLYYEYVTAPVWEVAVMFIYIQYLFPPFSSSSKPSILIYAGPKSWRAVHFVEPGPSVTIPGCTLSAVHRCKHLAPPDKHQQMLGDWCAQRFHATELREEGKNAPRLIPSSYSKKRGGTRPRIRLTVLQELDKNLSQKRDVYALGIKCAAALCTQNFLTSGGFTHEICEKWCSWTPVSQRSIF